MLLFPSLALAASLTLNPNALDSGTERFKGDHIAQWDEAAKPNGLLLLSLGGTGSLPEDMSDFNTEAAKLGYATLALDYVNDKVKVQGKEIADAPVQGNISTSCRGSKDKSCFDNFRREVVKGEQVSHQARVDRRNSIEHRIETALRELAKKVPARWGKFLTPENQVNWSKIVVAGHSQGSGHTAFLAKLHPLRGAVMLAGPQDSFADGETAPWLDLPSRTPSDRFYSFLHKNDFFGSQKQIAVARVLMKNPSAAVRPEADCGDAHILLTERNDVGDPHMSVIEPFFREIWAKLLEQQVGK